MKLVIGNELHEHTPNTYEVIITTMIGDADGYVDINVGPFIKDEDEASIQYLLETLDRLDKAFPNGRWGGTDYNDVEGFLPWFGGMDYTEDDYATYAAGAPITYAEHVEAAKLVGEFYNDWPSDAQSNDGSPTSYDRFKIFYYDENTVKHSVTVED